MAKCAFVTGAGTGIGRGIALHLAENGYDVGLHYNSSSEGAESAAAEIRSMGRRAEIFRGNLRDTDAICEMFTEFEAVFGAPDIFVNNAGITKKAPFLETTPEMFDDVMGVDYRAAYFCMQAAARSMVKHRIRGSIVLITSNHAYAHFGDASVYGSVKAAAAKVVEHAAIELARYGIRVNSVCPGWTDTGAARLGNKEDSFYKIPLQRWTTPEEVAKAVLYLSGDGAASITGTHLVIDGGALLQSDKPEIYGFYP